MKTYNTYITIKRFEGHAICGDINLPEGTELKVVRNFILCDNGPICTTASQTAYDYFAQNDDGNGLKRGELTQDILKRLRKLKATDSRYAHVWDKIWNDSICLKYKRAEHDDHWLWNYDFYNAEIEDLEYIRNLVMKG